MLVKLVIVKFGFRIVKKCHYYLLFMPEIKKGTKKTPRQSLVAEVSINF